MDDLEYDWTDNSSPDTIQYKIFKDSYKIHIQILNILDWNHENRFRDRKGEKVKTLRFFLHKLRIKGTINTNHNAKGV